MMGQGGNREEEKDAVNFTKIQAAAQNHEILK